MAIKALSKPTLPERGLRPLNPARDLAQVADLISIAFANELEADGQSALRDMQTVGRLSPLLAVLLQAADGFGSWYSGFVWVEDGRIVGNVTIQRLDSYGHRWQIANVAVLPPYRGRGIGRALMEAALDYITAEEGQWCILQVRADNERARGLYERLGFQPIMEVTDMRLPRIAPTLDVPPRPNLPLQPRRPAEWEADYQLALDCTPVMAQWLYPLRPHAFKRGWGQRLSESIARLLGQRHVIREGLYDGKRLLAAFTLTATLWRGVHRLTLLVHPDYRGLGWEAGIVERALGLLARYPRRAVVASHLASHPEAIAALEQHHFRTVRSLITMRRWMSQTGQSADAGTTPEIKT